ncbi:hypothetical protein GGI08_002933 [Coemansia sp. S2]|nr:hypothetical protein GGI08_002933 [Coemansia sp. S2]KAJ2346617.1 hypothetical protein GGH92_003518 [Coemansia sp. RSA 2673]
MIHCFVGLGALTYTWVSGITLFKSAVQGVQDGASAIEAATGAIKATTSAIKATTSAIEATTGAIEAATGAILAIAKRVDSVVGAVQAAELLAQSSQAPRYDNVILQHIEDIGGVHCLAIGLAVGLAIGLLIGMFVASRIWAAATRSVLAKESAIGQASPATSPLVTRATHQTTSAAPQATPSAAPQAPPATSPLASPTTHKAQTAAHQAQTVAGPLVKPTAHQAQTAAGPLAPPASPQAQSDDGEASLQLFKPVLDPASVETRAARLGRAIRTLRRPCVANATSATLPVNSYDQGAASSLLKFGNTRNVRFGGNSGGQPHLPNANGKYTPRPDMELTSGNDANMRQELPDDESSLATDDEITMNVREFSDDDNDNDDYSRKSANSASSGDESSTEVVVPPTDNLDVYSDDWFDDTPTRGTENNSVGSESQDDEDNQAPLEESVERVENTGVVIPVIAVQPTEFATRAEPVTGTNEYDYSQQRVGTSSSTKAPGPSEGVLAASSSHAIIQPVVARARPSEEGKAAEGTNASSRSSSAVATPIPAAQHKEQVSSAGTKRTNKVQPNSTGISQEAAHIGYALWAEAQDADRPEAVSVAEPMSASEPSSVAGLLAAASASLLAQVDEQGAETDSTPPQSPAVRRRTIVNEPADGPLVDDYASVVAISELRLRRHRRWSANSEPATPTATSIAAKKKTKSEAGRMFIMADKTMIPRRERRGSLGYIADRLVEIKKDFSTKVIGSLEAAHEVFEAYRAQIAESERPAAPPRQPTGPPPARAWQVAGQGASTSGNQQPRNSKQQKSNSRAGNDQRQQQSGRRDNNRQQARNDQPNHGQQQQQQHNGQQQHNNQQQNGGQPRHRQNRRGNNRGHGNNHS